MLHSPVEPNFQKGTDPLNEFSSTNITFTAHLHNLDCTLK